jgi:hypothetical protein
MNCEYWKDIFVRLPKLIITAAFLEIFALACCADFRFFFALDQDILTFYRWITR